MQIKPGKYTIQELIDSEVIQIGDGYRAKNSELTKSGEGYPFARAANLNNGFHFDGADLFPLEDIGKVGAKKSIPNDCVFTSKGTVGRIAHVNESVDEFVYSPQLCYWRSIDSKTVDPIYLYYWMNGNEFKHQIDYLKGQTDMADYVSLRDQRKMSFTIPDHKVQVAISSMVAPIDKKIELNRKINANLEAIAQSIFKSWFVDFDPVHAKARGEMPKGMNAETAALFPSEFVDSELGKIPKGWGVNSIGSLCEITKGKSYKSSELETSKTALVTLKSFNRGGGYRLDGLKEYTGKYKDAQVVKSGDVIIAYTDVTQAADVIGKPAMVISNPNYSNLVISLDVAVVRAKDSTFKQYIYGIAQSPRFQRHVSGHTTGTTVLHLSKDAVPGYITVWPTPNILKAFNSIICPLYSQIEANIHEESSLNRTRDSLLPKLLSGELKV